MKQECKKGSTGQAHRLRLWQKTGGGSNETSTHRNHLESHQSVVHENEGLLPGCYHSADYVLSLELKSVYPNSERLGLPTTLRPFSGFVPLDTVLACKARVYHGLKGAIPMSINYQMLTFIGINHFKTPFRV